MDCTKESANILLEAFNRYKKAIDNNDLSQASFPLVGEDALFELVIKRETLQWVLEMLNIQDLPEEQ